MSISLNDAMCSYFLTNEVKTCDVNRELKVKWNNLKAHSHPNICAIMCAIEEELIASLQVAGKCKLQLSLVEKEQVLEAEVHDLFLELSEKFDTGSAFRGVIPVGLALHDAVQRRWEDEAFKVMWKKVKLAPGLAGVVPELGSLIEQRDWLKDNAEPLKAVIQIDLKGSLLEVIPPEIFSLTHLKLLDLSSNNIVFLPEHLANLTDLLILRIGCNQITAIPFALGRLPQLVRFELNSNPIHRFPVETNSFASLKTLMLNNAGLLSIDSIADLTRLETLQLVANKISIIPDRFSRLINLNTLVLDRNEIESLSLSLSNLTRLQDLSLSRNRFTEIPKCIAGLVSLKTLSLHNNQIKAIPGCLGSLTQLEDLWLHCNEIKEIPEWADSLQGLKTFYIFSNQIKSIPDCLGKLPQLTGLQMHHNQIEIIPKSFQGLTSLVSLKLGANRIEVIPDFFGNFVHLKSLELEGNSIAMIPTSLGNLTNLLKLALDNNQIAEISNFKPPRSMKVFSLKGNPVDKSADKK